MPICSECEKEYPKEEKTRLILAGFGGIFCAECYRAYVIAMAKSLRLYDNYHKTPLGFVMEQVVS